MTENPPKPKPSNSETPLLSHNDLLDNLDTLLERYLTLLDTYTTTQQQLTAHLQSGYLSLAKANFDSSNRTRYGQDFYDERMQALRRMRMDEGAEEDAGKAAMRLSVVMMGSGQEQTPSRDGKEGSGTRVQLPSPPPTPAADDEDEEEEDEDEDTEDPSQQEEPTATDEKTPQIQDPIRMFGLLVPRSLRSAQGSFTSAVTGPVPDLVNVNRQMRMLENEIGRLRKQIRKI